MATTESERPHFWVAHGCTGCHFGDRLHVGCVIDGNVKVVGEGRVRKEEPTGKKLVVEKPEKS